jgi:predicted NBD/HSP70 family sugar kinase
MNKTAHDRDAMSDEAIGVAIARPDFLDKLAELERVLAEAESMPSAERIGEILGIPSRAVSNALVGIAAEMVAEAGGVVQFFMPDAPPNNRRN